MMPKKSNSRSSRRIRARMAICCLVKELMSNQLMTTKAKAWMEIRWVEVAAEVATTWATKALTIIRKAMIWAMEAIEATTLKVVEAVATISSSLEPMARPFTSQIHMYR